MKLDRSRLITKLGERGFGRVSAESLAGQVVALWQPGPGKWAVNSGESSFRVTRGGDVIYETPSQLIAVTITEVLNELGA